MEKNGRRKLSRGLICAVLAVALVLTGTLTWNALAVDYLEMPEGPGYPLMNATMVNVYNTSRWSQFFDYVDQYNAVNMTQRRMLQDGGAWLLSWSSDDKISESQIIAENVGSWTFSLHGPDFTGYVNSDMEEMIYAQWDTTDWLYRSGDDWVSTDGFGLREADNGLVEMWGMSKWTPYNGFGFTVTGSGPMRINYPRYLIADTKGPGQSKGWDASVTREADKYGGNPVIWLKCEDRVRPANKEITYNELATLKIRVALVPRSEPKASPVYVTAYAVDIQNGDDYGMIGFQVDESQWKGIAGKEYRITGITNASTPGSYEIYSYHIDDILTSYGYFISNGEKVESWTPYTVEYPITDLAGNAVVLDTVKNTNVYVKDLLYDREPPTVSEVKLITTAMSLGSVSDSEASAENMYAVVGHTARAELVLNEALAEPERIDRDSVAITWNVTDKNGKNVVTYLNDIKTNRLSTQGEPVTTLVFKPFTIEEGMEPQGQMLQPIAISGVRAMHDYYNNPMVQTDVSGTLPSAKNFLDTQPPVAQLEENSTIKVNAVENAQGAVQTLQLTIPININDGEGTVAGVSGTKGQLSIRGSEGAPEMDYIFTVNNSAQFPDISELTNAGTTSSNGSLQYASFPVHEVGSVYLHIQLDNLADVELNEEQGLVLDLRLIDKAGNVGACSVTANKLNVDNVGPAITLTNQGVEISTATDELNQALFTVGISVEDANAVENINYAWYDEGGALVDSGEVTDGTASITVTGVQTITRKLVVTAADSFNNESTQELTVSADLDRALGQYQVNTDLSKPSASHDIRVMKPGSTDSNADLTNASTRATLEMGGKTYARIFNADRYENLLDQSASWYEVTVADGIYTAVTPNVTPDWSWYGYIDLTLVSSLSDLTPVVGGSETPADTTYGLDLQTRIAYAPKNDGAHAAIFVQLRDNSGQALSLSESGGYKYYKFNESLTGVKYSFTLSNAVVSDWAGSDVDTAKSYAVLVKVNPDGTVEGTEVSQRIQLGRGENQTLSVPALDLETGAYTWRIYIAQKGGGGQLVEAGERLLLDNADIPSRFGVVSYQGEVDAVYGTNNTQGIPWARTAEDGEVLSAVNYGVAKPSDLSGNYRDADGDGVDDFLCENVTVYDADGKAAYVLENQNSLEDSRNWSVTSTKITLTADLSAETDYGTWLGVELGGVNSIRYWNKASSGDYGSLEFSYAAREHSLTIQADLGWYSPDEQECIIVSAEELAAADVSDFKLALGSNTICYQLKMDNGTESPVYEFDLNLIDEAPTIELELDYGNSVYEMDYEYDDNWNLVSVTPVKQYSEYVDVYVTDAFSPSGSLSIYHCEYNDTTRQFDYTLVEPGQPIRIDQNVYGYAGVNGTRNDGNKPESVTEAHSVREFICVVDGVGNAVSAYPILTDVENNEANEFYYGIREGCTAVTADYYAPKTAGASYDDALTHSIMFNKENGVSISDQAGALEVRIDDGTPVTLDLDAYFGGDPNSAGIVDLRNEYSINSDSYGYRDMLRFVAPYDPAVAEGEIVTHTVTVTVYAQTLDGTQGAVLLEESFEFTAANEKPTVWLNPYSNSDPGYIQFDSNTYVDGGDGYVSNSFYRAIYTNGTYDIAFRDAYGNEYVVPVEVTTLPTDPVITVSETGPTCGPVVVTATSELYTMQVGTNYTGGLKSTTTVAGSGTNSLTVTLAENDSFYINLIDAQGNEVDYVSLSIDNIYTAEIVPYISWSYRELETEEGDKEPRTVYGQVVASLMDENGSLLMDPRTGEQAAFTFVPGGETEYTFSGYVNQYGMTGPDITATLTVDLEPYPVESVKEDTYSPDVGMIAYVTRNGAGKDLGAVYQKLGSRTEESRASYHLPDYTQMYGAESVYTDLDSLIGRMGWADSYLFNVNVADESKVKLFVKADLYGEVPTYDGASDAIEGVSLVGRTLQISANREFALYAVDEENNYTAIHVKVTALGDPPVPEAVQVPATVVTDGEVRYVARLYLLEPNVEGVSNLTITNVDPVPLVDDDTSSDYLGYQYLLYRENATVPVYYSYEYDGQTYRGDMMVAITIINNEPPAWEKVTWSANAALEATREDVTAQIAFNKDLRLVYAVDDSGSRIPDTDLREAGVTISYFGSNVTVHYERNYGELNLKFFALDNNLSGEALLTLDEVQNIDREVPVVTSSVEYSANHRSAVVTFNSEEYVIFQETGRRGREFTRTLRENGTFRYAVIDPAGNIGYAEVTLDGIITEDLLLEVSTNGTDSGIVDPADYEAKIGEILYVRTNRDAYLYLNDEALAGTVWQAGIWHAVTITEDSMGLHPVIRAVDEYANTALVQLLRIPMSDRKAPSLKVIYTTVSASVEATDEQISQLLLENIIYSDETTARDQLDVDFDYLRPASGGRVTVTYRVTDEAGNTTEKKGILRLYTGVEPVVLITTTEDGQTVVKEAGWFNTVEVEPGTVSFEIRLNGEPYKLDWEWGILKPSQLKEGSVSVTDGYIDDEKFTFDMELNTSDEYYTFCLTTQGREVYRFLVYVK